MKHYCCSIAGGKAAETAALQDAPRISATNSPRASVLKCGGSTPLFTWKLTLLILMLANAMASAQSSNLTSLLQQGLLEEQANGNLNAAIADYKSLAEEFDKNRQLAATAAFRLGECYRAQGKTNEAVAQYQRILREFPDEQTLANMSRQNLMGLGVALSQAAVAPKTELANGEDKEIQRIQQMMQNSPDLVDKGELDHAANSGELRVTAFILDHGADVNGSDNGGPPLCQAVDGGQKAMVELLLSRGADVNARARDGSGATALLKATANGYQAVVEVLLAHKADVNAHYTGMNSFTPLHIAARRGDSNLIKAFLDAGANPNSVDADGQTPLGQAIESGHLEIAKALLAAKADPNRFTKRSPLMIAIHQKDADAVELLLTAGANPNTASDGQWTPGYGNHTTVTPLWLAINSDQIPMVKLLLEFKVDADGMPLFGAIFNPGILAMLLDAGAKADYRAPSGRTPLLWASMSGISPRPLPDRKVFELLLDHHADPNARDNEGETPLSLVSRSKDTNAPQIAALLRQYGAVENPANWDRIEVNRLSGLDPFVVFRKGSNDWNHFTLLETILDYYETGFKYRSLGSPGMESSIFDHQIPGGLPLPKPRENTMPFPDLTHVVIVRPSHDSTNLTRITVNFGDSPNVVETSKDVSLEFGDMVEIPQRDHSLGDSPWRLTDNQISSMTDYLHGTAHLVTRDQKADLPLDPYGNASCIEPVLGQPEARRLLLTSSDLSHVKVTRHDSKSGKESEWIVDCTTSQPADAQIRLRDGDVIDVPEKQ
jgi:ankyrin repeat protein